MGKNGYKMREFTEKKKQKFLKACFQKPIFDLYLFILFLIKCLFSSIDIRYTKIIQGKS